MIRYKIRLETKYNLLYLKKEYTSISNVLKAIYMINLHKYGSNIIRIAKFRDDIQISLSDQIIL